MIGSWIFWWAADELGFRCGVGINCHLLIKSYQDKKEIVVEMLEGQNWIESTVGGGGWKSNAEFEQKQNRADSTSWGTLSKQEVV